MTDWWEDHRNVADLIRYLVDQAHILETVPAVMGVIEKPYHWSREYEDMRADERAAA